MRPVSRKNKNSFDYLILHLSVGMLSIYQHFKLHIAYLGNGTLLKAPQAMF